MKKRILILSHDNKVGDAIVATGLLSPLRTHLPECEIGVLCGPSNDALYEYHPAVKWLHVSRSRNIFARIWASIKARHVRYDIVVHFGLNLSNPSEYLLLNVVNAKQRYLFMKHPIKTLPNDVVIDGISKDSHYSKRHELFLQKLGISLSNYRYDIRIDQNIIEPIKTKTNCVLVINSQGSAHDRSLDSIWLHNFITEVLKLHPRIEVILLSANELHQNTLIKDMSPFKNRVIVSPFHPSVSHALKVISSADIVLTPDTYAVHAASAWNIPVIALYLPGGPTKLWAPLSSNYVQIEAAPGKKVKDIEVSDALQALNQILLSSSTHQ
jgi:ADP-heptose:LPS heptosyltransferase